MYLYLGNHPRTLYLVTSSQDERTGCPRRALVFRAAEGASSSSQAVVEFLPKEEVDLSNAVRLTSRIVKGCLGLISVANDIFLAVIVSATEVGNTRPCAPTPETVGQIHDVGFFSLNSATWDEVSADMPGTPGFDDSDMFAQDAYATNPNGTPVMEHPCQPLKKIIAGATFYYAMAPQWDISSRLTKRITRTEQWDAAVFDERFVWNEYMVKSLLDFRERLDAQERADIDRCQFIVLAIHGYVGVTTLALASPPTHGTPAVATITLISRLGWKRAGTRFNTRGVDDDGNCANFVETETIFSTDQHCFSYVQVRGSVPLFWEQQGLQTFGHRIQITRAQASQPAFDRHFSGLMDEYGAVHAVNLLGSKENEAALTSAYARHIMSTKNVLGDSIGITAFDFHNAVRVGGHECVFREIRRLEDIVDNVDRFGFAMVDATTSEIITEQKGVFRTNCLDCLDRTNFVQDILSRYTLEQYIMATRREWLQSGTIWSRHGELWAENGDALSRSYAGTKALGTSTTRSGGRRTFTDVLSDATKSVSRAYINNFQDKSKQNAIDLMLGNLSGQRQVTIFDPIHDSVRAVLHSRISEYSTTKQCTVFTGTWNVNGKPPSSETLLPWLFPRPSAPEPDIIALGFQEIVPLNAQQVLQTDPETRKMWEALILRTINGRPHRQSTYIPIAAQQLVGTALLILVKEKLSGEIRSLDSATHKTGFRGMSGNKGAVAVRLDYNDTSFCFVTAHLAAGHTNVAERNADYRTIVDGLKFRKGQTINHHQNIIWMADTNYRIDIDNDTVRELAFADDFDALLVGDQLKRAIDERQVFQGFQEGPLLFRPTYKYDIGTDTYDTGEKMRIPAWTDRILFRGPQLDLAVYSRAELKSSDHRPVFAMFRAEIRTIDKEKRDALKKLLLASVTSHAPGETLDEKLAEMTFFAGEPYTPPPSTDDFAWWDKPEHPNGIMIPTAHDSNGTRRAGANPFDSSGESSLSASPSSSEEDIYHQLQAPLAPAPATTVTRRPPPPPPSRKPVPKEEQEG